RGPGGAEISGRVDDLDPRVGAPIGLQELNRIVQGRAIVADTQLPTRIALAEHRPDRFIEETGRRVVYGHQDADAQRAHTRSRGYFAHGRARGTQGAPPRRGPVTNSRDGSEHLARSERPAQTP